MPESNPDRTIHDITEIDASVSLPGTLLRILECLRDERSTKNSVARVIEGDPDLTERVLSAANSPLYLTFNDRIDEKAPPVTNLPIAVLKLGFSGIRNLAFTQGLCEMARGGHELGVDIVVHLLVVAELARALGFQRRRALGEDAYFAGLMHDFGKLALLRALPLDYLRIAAWCRARKAPALQAENALLAPGQPLLGNHVQTGAELLRTHGIPEPTVLAVEAHHQDPAERLQEGNEWDIAGLVIVANHLAYEYGYGDGLSDPGASYMSIPELCSLLNLEHGELERVARDGITRASDALLAARVPIKPTLLQKVRKLGASMPPGGTDPRDAARATDEPYGACMTLIDLARSRPAVGFYDFKAHTGLSDPALETYLGRLVDAQYLRPSRAASSGRSYQATTKLHLDRPHDILQMLLAEHEERKPDVA